MNNNNPNSNEDEAENEHKYDLRVFRYRAYRHRKGLKRCIKGYLADLGWGFVHELKKAAFLVEVVGIGVLIVYTAYTIKMYSANTWIMRRG